MQKRWLFVLAMLLMLVSIGYAQTELIGPETYPEGINPLTGLPAEDPELLDRRPLLIRISNFPPFVREYQRGLNDAEVVWEYLLAGGVTRFSAVFYEKDLPQVGPIRSGRLPDFELTRMYRSLYAYSGFSQGVTEILLNDPLMVERAVGGSGPCPPLCRYPQDGLALEHTLFGDTLALRTEHALARGADLSPEPVYGMAFDEATPAGGVPLESVLVRYREMDVRWVWDADAQAWMRFTDGEAHNDREQERQVQAVNVVIVEAEHTEQPFVRDQYWGPANFEFSVNFIDSGRIFFLRDGRYYEGEWRRETRDDPLTFFDLEGNVLPFHPGNTFFNLVPLWFDSYELELVRTEPLTITVTGDTGVAMRFGPSEDYISPDVAYAGDTFYVTGRNYQGTWLQVLRQYDTSERAIWLPIERLDMDELAAQGIAVMDLPLPRPSSER